LLHHHVHSKINGLCRAAAKGDHGSISDKLQTTDAVNEFRCSAHKLLILRSCGIRCRVEWSRTLRSTGQIGSMRLRLEPQPSGLMLKILSVTLMKA